jgi:hypothetical protein
MKTGLTIYCLAGLLTSQLFAGPETIIREKAKQLRDQNNARQGVPPPASPAAPPAQPAQTAARPAATAPAAQPPGFARLQSNLAAIRPNSPSSASQKQLLAQDLIATAQGPQKPSATLAAKLSDHLVVALAEKTLPAADRSRLAQNLNGALNPAGLQPAQVQAIAADVQAIFQKSGVSQNNAVAVANDLKELAGQFQKTAAK